MRVAHGHILTLVALLLVNSGVGRAMHTLVAHSAPDHGSAATLVMEGDSLPEAPESEECPECDVLRAGAIHTPRVDPPGWSAQTLVGLLPTERVCAPRDAAHPLAQPRAPPIA